MELYPKLILEALSHVTHPATGKNIVESGIVEDDIRIEGRKVSFSLLLKSTDPLAKSLVKASETAILTYIGPDVEIKGNIAVKSPVEPQTEKEEPLKGVKYKIAISSGKGGVGKSTVSANLAISLAKAGYKVGLLDADIFGPSIPKMFGVEGATPYADENGMILPIEKYGVKMLSIGFFVNTDSAIVWRGAMASGAIKQLLTEAAWGELDYLLIDLPPGTSDIHLTVVQTIKLDGAIVVSTPQQVALADAVRGIDMFQNEKINVPVLGLIENMAWFTPKELPENRYYIFGKEGVSRLAEERGIRLLGQIPLVQGICEGGDNGVPVSLSDTITALAFDNIAKSVVFQ
ncbi:MAG: Mrp/NBP35 family ATP-binding protein [Paludibacteraceae bacterium]|nr:Mrp/NBP35 family ATP-binding protein [Paludibacteraceae bacterium]MBQ1852014.1 Mrp/NBP35 family ATP-binding protein [Paludibacteraceae bacterium]MBQ2065754.1 Mrp/NBP35 family ATP-binding protein [Paludibacteraceae bacterium]